MQACFEWSDANLSYFLNNRMQTSAIFKTTPMISSTLAIVRSSICVQRMTPTMAKSMNPMLSQFLATSILLLSAYSNLLWWRRFGRTA